MKNFFRLSEHFAWAHNNLSVPLKLKTGSYYFICSANQKAIKKLFIVLSGTLKSLSIQAKCLNGRIIL